MSAIAKLVLTVEAILKNTAAYGFTFRPETVEKDGKVFRGRPVMYITDHELFRQAFPDIARERLEASVKISSQAHARTSEPEAEIQAANVRWLLGERVTRPQLKYVAADGTKHATPEDAAKVNAAIVAAEVERRMKQA